MTVIWGFSAFGFFMVPFYLNKMDANIYYLSLATEVAELLGSVFCVFVARLMDLRRAFFMCCCLISVGCIAMMATHKDEPGSILDNLLPAGLIMITNLGVVIAFDVAYLMNA